MPRPRTVSDEQILAVIADLTERHGMPPTYEEIGEVAGICRVAVLLRLRALRRAGSVEYQERRPRTVRIKSAAVSLESSILRELDRLTVRRARADGGRA